jgi:hypothetical protein
MTSLISREEKRERRMIPYKTALSKLSPHKMDEKLLIFNMAAKTYFWRANPSSEIIERLGREEAAKLTLEEFLAMVEAEMPPEEEMIQRFLKGLSITYAKKPKTRQTKEAAKPDEKNLNKREIETDPI